MANGVESWIVRPPTERQGQAINDNILRYQIQHCGIGACVYWHDVVGKLCSAQLRMHQQFMMS